MNLYVQRQDLNALLATPEAAHEVAVLLENDELLPTVQQKLKAILPDLKIENWREISPESDLIASYTGQSAMIIVAIIVIALAFGIVNTMLMAVLERTREIGMLMALGMRKERLVTMIVAETCMLTLIGVPVGLLLAWATVEWLSKKGIDFSVFANDMMSEFGFSAILYPELPWNSVLQVVIIVICAALLASIYPAMKTVRLKPVEAIKQ
ncbi:MAG: FtsX-like permease family protein [Saprospiraceae bacterium]|nr:FtsX-like permease family protein [Saprospiraceae bacterium]